MIILGGYFCFASILCIPAAIFADDVTLKERIFLLIASVAIAFVNRLICRLGFKLKGRETSAPKQCFLTKLARIMLFAGIGGGVSLAVPLTLVYSVEKWSLVGMIALVVSTAGLILGVIGVIIDMIRREEAAAEEDTKYKCAQPQEDLNDARYQAEQMFQRGGLDREQAYAAYGLDSDGNKLK
ncbi:MAG: hypothetical protein MR871_09445 [Lachnospiraceae bacterium]|nr:hypothetical protein [Lachnospiraceae bacterium]